MSVRVSNANEVAKEILDYKTEVERKLRGMVSMFAYAATRAIQEKTPIGDQASIDAGEIAANGPQKAYYELYSKRNDRFGIGGGDDIEVGFHRGAFGYSESGNFQFVPVVMDELTAAEDLQMDVEAYYAIGDKFFIGAEGPGYSALEAGSSEQAPDGISGPAMQVISDIYRMDMKTYYDASR